MAPGEPGTPLQTEWKKYRTSIWWILLGSLALLLLIALFPTFIAWIIGPVALTVIAITAWTTAIGAFTIALQDYRPLALFRLMRLKATPVLTLAITVPLIYGAVVTSLGGDPALHAVRSAVEPAAAMPGDAEPSLEGRLAELDCQVQIGGRTVQPALLVVAEGGGIRAAYWTGRVLEELNAKHGCLGRSVLVSSGVSGGSVGLAISATTGDSSITDQLQKLVSPETVGSAVAGLVVGDAIATATGVRVPSFVHDEGLRWRDRAGLIESGWTDDATGFGSAYDPSPTDRTGFLIMNSTDTNTKCRILIGADVFPETKTSDEGCNLSTDQPAASRWLGSECQTTLDWASAAMLSARFPIITPAGRPTAEECSTAKRMQLIDGGYAEGSGLGTMADLAPSIASAIRTHNEQADSGGTYIVPIIVYVRNSAGFDVAEKLSEVTAEPLVPLVGWSAKGAQAAEAAWIQRITSTLIDVCPTTGDCGANQRAVRTAFGNGVVVVAPTTRPAVVPPLGWALSTHSMESLNEALKTELTCSEPEPPADAPFVRLCHLVGLDVDDE